MTDWTCKRCMLVTSADHSTGDCISALRKRVKLLEVEVQARKEMAKEAAPTMHLEDWRYLAKVTPISQGVISGAGGAGGSGFASSAGRYQVSCDRVNWFSVDHGGPVEVPSASGGSVYVRGSSFPHSGACSMAECQGECLKP